MNYYFGTIVLVLASMVMLTNASSQCYYEGFVVQRGDFNYAVGGGYSGIHKGPGTSGTLYYYNTVHNAIKFTVDQGAGVMTILNDVELAVDGIGANVAIKFLQGSTLTFDPTQNRHSQQQVKDLNRRTSTALFHTGGQLAFEILRDGVVQQTSAITFLSQRFGSTDFNSIAFRKSQDLISGEHTATISLWGTEGPSDPHQDSWQYAKPGQVYPLAVDMVFSGNYKCDDDVTPDGDDEEDCPQLGSETATYKLLNHPDGNAGGDYGLRLDDIVAGTDPMTFNFNVGGADMRMTVNVDPATGDFGDIRVFGRAKQNQVPYTWWVIEFTWRDAFRNANNPQLIDIPKGNSVGFIHREGDADNKILLEEEDMNNIVGHIQLGHRCGGGKCPADTYVGYGWVDEINHNRDNTRDFLFLVGECVGDDDVTPDGDDEEDEECTDLRVRPDCKCVSQAHSQGNKCVTLCFDPNGINVPCNSIVHNTD
eukprot:TRINITY_DN95094_c0_g1_i1.p1 TRINITY_DN95094_c0_g1~~TRINITY_DN95094_c0_g1_i1.p1  ORF type:complete len:488 (-),score=299.20 TRINITY_DN95094_c0_g1_i1:184-1620(-)